MSQQFIHPYYGKSEILSKIPRTRGKYNCVCLDKGKGWDEDRQKHVGVKTKSEEGQTWSRHKGPHYEEEFICKLKIEGNEVEVVG